MYLNAIYSVASKKILSRKTIYKSGITTQSIVLSREDLDFYQHRQQQYVLNNKRKEKKMGKKGDTDSRIMVIEG